MIHRPGYYQPLKVKGEELYIQCPNIICIVDRNRVYILGIAHRNVLHTYKVNNLTFTANNPDKTVFFGFDHLNPIPKTLVELKEYCEKDSEAQEGFC